MLEDLAHKVDYATADSRTLTQKLSDEAVYLSGSAKSFGSGIRQELADWFNEPWRPATIGALSATAAVVGTLNPYARYAMGALGLLGAGAIVAPGAVSVWKDHNAIDTASEQLGLRLGRVALETPLALGAGTMTVFGARMLARAWISELSSPMNLATLDPYTHHVIGAIESSLLRPGLTMTAPLERVRTR